MGACTHLLQGDVLNFKLEVTDNPLKNDITLQLFLGRCECIVCYSAGVDYWADQEW